MAPEAFINRLKHRLANVAIGASTLRGKGTVGVAAATREALAGINLSSFAVADQNKFRKRLNRATIKVAQSMPESGRAWGRARKAVNIFLRDVVYNADLCDHYELRRIRGWLELPLDRRHVAKGLDQAEGADLPRWPGVMHLTPDVSEAYQALAFSVAKRYGVNRVDLDVFFCRAAP